MRNRLAGPSPASSASLALRLCAAAALLVPLLAACGSGSGGEVVNVSPGAGAGGNETPAPAPSATPPYCGLKPEGQPERTDSGMTFPATTDYQGKPLEEVRQLAKSRGFDVRLVGEDGSCNAMTDDLRIDRINVYVESGTVVASGAF
jgi:hypothetical protein